MGETVKKLIVEVVEARDLLPKDGVGTSSPYVVADYNGQRKKTQTVHRNLNPSWNETLEFDVNFGSGSVDWSSEPVEVEVFHDKKVGPSRRNNFLGRVILDSTQVVRKGEEALMFFPLQKKKFFFSSWVRGDLGLKVYYADVPEPEPEPEPQPEPEPEATPVPVEPDIGPQPPPSLQEQTDEAASPLPSMETHEVPIDPQPMAPPPEGEGLNESKPPSLEPEVKAKTTEEKATTITGSPPPQELKSTPQRAIPIPIPAARQSEKIPETTIERSTYDLVEKMQYLFVRIVRARYLPSKAKPRVRISTSGRHVTSRPTVKAAFFEFDQTFSFPRNASSDSSLEISVWDSDDDDNHDDDDNDKYFLGGLCFDTSEIPVRDPPDSPLATQWYRLEGGGARRRDLMLATWIGTQADEAFHHAWRVEDDVACHVSTKSKVYMTPRLWYMRLTVIEAQDVAAPRDAHVSVKATSGYQSVRTRFAANRTGSPGWGEDLFLVVAQPFGEQTVTLCLEARQGSGASAIGFASLEMSGIERRVDDRQVASRWVALEAMEEEKKGKEMAFGGGFGLGRLHVRACLDGGYHVAEEPAHSASDYRPSARQLWKQPIGTVELGIIACKGLLPLKTIQTKGTTDAFVVAKYGPKWARTRTVLGTLDPAWNEQYTWQVYDPSTVLTVGVFDDDRDSQKGMSRPIGRVRIRISTLDNERAYRTFYPLLLVLANGLKKMGEIELAVRFSRSVQSLDVVHIYGKPMLPIMHHLRPIPSSQREPLRSAAARTIAAHLSRSDPPLRREVSTYILDAESPPRYSMRKVRQNWQRIVSSLSWAGELFRFIRDTRTWKNPTTTMLMHGIMVLLVLYPNLIVPAVTLHVSAVGAWKYRNRPCGPGGRGWEVNVGEYAIGGALMEEIDEEMDSVPSGKSYEVLKARYDRLRMVAARVQGVLGDVAAHGERVQALVTWRDPRATAIFVVICLLISVILYMVPMKMVVVGLGFYYFRHPMFRDSASSPAINFFQRLPSLSDRYL